MYARPEWGWNEDCAIRGGGLPSLVQQRTHVPSATPSKRPDLPHCSSVEEQHISPRGRQIGLPPGRQHSNAALQIRRLFAPRAAHRNLPLLHGSHGGLCGAAASGWAAGRSGRPGRAPSARAAIARGVGAARPRSPALPSAPGAPPRSRPPPSARRETRTLGLLARPLPRAPRPLPRLRPRSRRPRPRPPRAQGAVGGV